MAPLAFFEQTAGASIRKARKEDFEAIAKMSKIIFPNSRLRVMEGDVFFIARREGIAVGFCHIRIKKGRKCYICGLGVLPQYREHGIGTALMREALSYAERKGVTFFYLKVRALNTAAKLYLSFGFFERKSGDTLTLVRKLPS